MIEMTLEEVLDRNGGLFYKSNGVSMLPLIREGRDQIYIVKCPAEQLKKYDVVLFRRQGVAGREVYVLHRILRINPDGSCWIVGDNCTRGETVRKENVLGVLTVVKRKGKEVNVSDFGYKLYTYLWCAPWPIRFFVLRCKGLIWSLIKKTVKVLRLR